MLVNALLRYYNDVWIYDIDKLEWRSVGKQGASGPSPRGGSLCLTCQHPVCCKSNCLRYVCSWVEHGCAGHRAQELAASNKVTQIETRRPADWKGGDSVFGRSGHAQRSPCTKLS